MVYNVNDLVRSAAIKYLSAPVGPVPGNTVAPAITGSTVTGQILTVSDGTWTDAPTGFTRQWRRNGSPIAGATGSTYTLIVADEGAMISATVTATNANGSGSATSSSVGPVTAVPAGPTYAEYQAHIATLPVLLNKYWGYSAYGLSGPVGTVGNYTTTANTLGRGIMAGTSWFDGSLVGAFDDTNTNVAPTIIHGLPSAAEAVNQENNSYQIYVTVEIIETTTRAGLTRNGFASTAATETANLKITKIIYWDGTKPMQMNPSTGSGPTPYTW